MIQDIVPNPFVGHEIVSRLVGTLVRRGFDETRMCQLAGLIVEVLRTGLEKERNTRAEAIFRHEVSAGTIQFRLRLDDRDWRMPFHLETSEPDSARQLLSASGGPLQKSLFAPIYENEFNRDERDVAVYLDGDEALAWWHRNVARTQYGIQGWKKGKIYPDFIFAVETEGSIDASPSWKPKVPISTTPTRNTSVACCRFFRTTLRGTTAFPAVNWNWCRKTVNPFNALSS